MTRVQQLAILLDDARSREAEEQLEEACRLAGIGLRTAQSRSRTVDTATRRAVVAYVLRSQGWTIERIAGALKRTPRQAKRLIAAQK